MIYKSFGDLLRQAARRNGEKSAFIVKKKEEKSVKYINISYKKFYDDVRALGKVFDEKGYKDKRIAVIGKNCYEWILSLLAVSYIGAVAVPLDKGLSETEIMEQMDRINADTLIFDKDYSEIAKRNTGRENICFNADEGFENIDDLLEKGYKKGILPEMDSDADKLALLLFTSGTTSKSKIVMLSQNNIIANIEDMHECEEFYDTDVNLAILPFHHTFGLTGILLFVSIGATNVFCEGLRIQKALIEYKVTVLVGVPLILDNIWHMIQRTLKKKKLTAVFSAVGFINRLCIKTGIDIRRKLYKSILDQLGGGLRCVISGAAPLNPETSAFFNSMGILTIQGYGLTETAPVIAAENPANMRLGSVGKAMPSIDIKIENAGEDNIGEIIAKGPNVMLGYYENPELTEQVMRGGYFHTGDLGYLDKDGYLFITGRLKNVIVLENGKNVYPEELEFYISQLDYVKETLVTNKKENGRDKITATVVVDTDEISVAEARKLFENDVKGINKRLANYKQIKDFEVTDKEFIKTTTGKIKRNIQK